MKTVLYDGSWEGFLSAVFDVYEYKLPDAEIIPEAMYEGSIFSVPHSVYTDSAKAGRVWKGLRGKVSAGAMKQVYKSFLSEIKGMETTILHYIQHCFSCTENIETDYGHPAVLTIFQTAKKVHREKHRMEAFVRFQKTADGLFYATVDPDFNVLPLIEDHFTKRYADQQWLIYDTKRKYGLHYDGKEVNEVTINFSEEAKTPSIHAVYDADEEMYQRLWQQYFKSVNIAARKNTKLHLQHMPKRYWKYLIEKSRVDSD